MQFTILTDTREQNPLKFPADIKTEMATLPTGDYTVKGIEDYICIERKELSDLIACVTTDRERFTRELHRMRAYQVKAVVVEATMIEILSHRYRSRVNPDSVIGSIAAWQSRHGIPFTFAGNREGASKFILATFQTYHRHLLDKLTKLIGKPQTKGE